MHLQQCDFGDVRSIEWTNSNKASFYGVRDGANDGKEGRVDGENHLLGLNEKLDSTCTKSALTVVERRNISRFARAISLVVVVRPV